ncbi:MAG: hypothetical protein K2I70_00320, partial [Bacilli bacterium]|nr:hypothetical protein [Bacilli bacterium]
DEFRSLKNIYITWNRASNYYEMTAEYGEAKYEINLENADLINFLLHQTNCCKVVIEHDKDSNLLSSLTACDTIKSITLNNCNITSIASLSCLSNLEEITINNCENISDISPLENLTNLKKIAINGTRVSDISILASLPNLTNLNLRCNEITNPEVLESLENINSLALEFNRISDIKLLRGLIDKDIISEEHALAIIESCETHRLSFTTENYQEEANVLYIIYIDSKESYFVELRNENQENLAFALTPDPFDFYNLTKDIPNCTGIKIANIPEDFQYFKIADAQKFDAMVIEQCDFDSISFVDDFKNLTYLSIENCPNVVNPFGWGAFDIDNLPNLKTLIVKGTSISDFDQLKKFSSLENVELKDNNIGNFDFLMNIPNLKIALIGVDNYPVDPKPLEEIQEQGVYVKVTGYYLPPLDEKEETLSSESEEQTESDAKGYGLTPEN